jgi:dipeptidase E
MKLLLTSGGLTTETLRQSFRALLRTSSKPRTVFIPTAARHSPDKSWLDADVENVRSAGTEVELVDISAAPIEQWLPTLQAADALCFGGGNTYFLLDWVRRSGLVNVLPSLLEHRLYMGISAGSMIAGPSIESNSPIFPEEDEGKIEDLRGLSLVEFAVIPHLLSPAFPHATTVEVGGFAARVRYPVYAIDDSSAVEVVEGRMRIVSTGRYEAYNQPLDRSGKESDH